MKIEFKEVNSSNRSEIKNLGSVAVIFDIAGSDSDSADKQEESLRRFDDYRTLSFNDLENLQFYRVSPWALKKRDFDDFMRGVKRGFYAPSFFTLGKVEGGYGKLFVHHQSPVGGALNKKVGVFAEVESAAQLNELIGFVNSHYRMISLHGLGALFKKEGRHEVIPGVFLSYSNGIFELSTED